MELCPNTYMILEHFADNSEETVLSSYGFMLWGNCNHDYNEITMGYSGSVLEAFIKEEVGLHLI